MTGLVAGIAASTIVVGTAFVFLQEANTKDVTRRPSSSQRYSRGDRRHSSTHDRSDKGGAAIPEELRLEQLSRHTLFFGKDGMQSIRSAKICIVGLGGVGSHTAVMLARGGATYLRLIDFDQVTLSSLNRHACATLSDVGIPKVTCVQRYCSSLGLPAASVDARVEMYTQSSGPQLLALKDGSKWDVVIDCIDDVPTKAALLTYCIQHKIRVLSCMGAGGKSDMTRLHISDLRTASRDPLASKLRQTMKKAMKQRRKDQEAGTASDSLDTSKPAVDDSWLDDMDQLTIIYSSETTVAKLADLTEEQKSQGDKSQYGAVDGMRIRVLPVLGPIPAIMGQSLAAITLCELGKKPIHQPVTGERVGKNVRNRLYQKLIDRELKITAGTLVCAAATDLNGTMHTGPVQIDGDDVEYLYGVWRNRCGISGARIGATLFLARWDMSKPATTDNLVLMSAPALQDFDWKGKESVPPAIQSRIEQRLAACRDMNVEL